MGINIGDTELRIILKYIKKQEDATWANFLKVVEDIRHYVSGYPLWPEGSHQKILSDLGDLPFDMNDPYEAYDILEKYIEEFENAWRTRKLH